MADYISREDLTNHLAICKKGTDIPNLAWATITAIECYVRDMPAADVVEVVRCEDCKNYRTYRTLELCARNAMVIGGKETVLSAICGNDFCSYAERS